MIQYNYNKYIGGNVVVRDSMIDILNEYYGCLDKMPITDHDIREYENDIASDLPSFAANAVVTAFWDITSSVDVPVV